jgi:hypothetical protein
VLIIVKLANKSPAPVEPESSSRGHIAPSLHASLSQQIPILILNTSPVMLAGKSWCTLPDWCAGNGSKLNPASYPKGIDKFSRGAKAAGERSQLFTLVLYGWNFKYTPHSLKIVLLEHTDNFTCTENLYLGFVSPIISPQIFFRAKFFMNLSIPCMFFVLAIKYLLI